VSVGAAVAGDREAERPGSHGAQTVEPDAVAATTRGLRDGTAVADLAAAGALGPPRPPPGTLRRPLAWTEHGRSYFEPAVASHPDADRIAAHEAVHAAQHRAGAGGDRRDPGGAVGDRSALEAEADRGASVLAQGRSFTPGLAAPPDLALGYGEEMLPDPGAVAEAEEADLAAGGFDPARSEVTAAVSSTTGAPGEPSEVRYRVETDGAGPHGSVISTTDIVVRHEPGARAVVTAGQQTRQLDPETGIFATADRPAYPYTITYTRHILYTDDDGRSAEVDIEGRMVFGEDSWQRQVGAVATPSFEALLGLQGDLGAMRSATIGTGPVTDYFWATEVTPADLSSQIAETAVAIAGGGLSAATGVTPTAGFVSPTLTAAHHHASLRRLLELDDAAAVTRQLAARGGADAPGWLEQALAALAGLLAPMADTLDELGEGAWDALPPSLQDDLVAFGEMVASLAAELAPLVQAIDDLAQSVGEWWDSLPPWARGVLRAIAGFAGGVAVIALIAGLVVLAAEGAVAFGTAMLIVGVIALGVGYVFGIVQRAGEAWDAGSPLAMVYVPQVALLDVVGISGLYEGVTNTSILTGGTLGLSEEQRWERGTTGVLQIGGLVVGLRGFRGGRVPATVEPVEVTFTGPRTGFDALPVERLPRNLPEGYAWRRPGTQWELVRDPEAPVQRVEISTFDDGTGRPNYVVQVEGRPVHGETVPRAPDDLFRTSQRLPAELEGTGVDNPMLTEEGVLFDKGHLGDVADTPSGPGVRPSTQAPENITPQAAWWNRWVRNNLVRRIRVDGHSYRELPVYDAQPPTTVGGQPIPREYVFMEVWPDGTPIQAWRIPNDPTLTNRSQSVLAQYVMEAADIPRVMLQADGTAAPPGTRVGPTVIVGTLGPHSPETDQPGPVPGPAEFEEEEEGAVR
jgi:hypothetical protein